MTSSYLSVPIEVIACMRTSIFSIRFWLTCAIGNRKPLPGHSWHHRPGRPLAYRLFSLGRIPARQHSISRDATEDFVGIELFVPDFEGERKGSTKPTMRAQIAGTARVVLDQLRFETIFWTTNYSRHPINTSLLL